MRKPTSSRNLPTDRSSKSPDAVSDRKDISDFLSAASKLGGDKSGRAGLIFALDATMSRQHIWDQAQHIQAQMFDAVAQTGGLDTQLVYFRGFGECRASKWVSQPTALQKLMSGIDVRGGQTQIGKVLAHARKEAAKRNPGNKGRSRVDALVFIGDAMEEQVDQLCNTAGELGLLSIPCFMFQEGHDRETETAFREIARLSRGAYARFDSGSANKLAELLKAVARFASGGRAALQQSNKPGDRLLLESLK